MGGEHESTGTSGTRGGTGKRGGKPTQVGVPPCANRGRGQLTESGVSFCVTQQWCPVYMLAQASSRNIPSCGAPYSCPFRLFLHSQQTSPLWVLSPNPTFQQSAPLPTSRHMTQAGVHSVVVRTSRVGLTLCCLSLTGCCALLQAPEAPSLSQLISPPVRGLH